MVTQHTIDNDKVWAMWRTKNTLPNGRKEFADISIECRNFRSREMHRITCHRLGVEPPTEKEREAYQEAYRKRNAVIFATDETR
jgi:hypothetical protein